MEPLFVASSQALLGSPPASSPPRRPANRRKTLAGSDICRTYGFTLRRATERARNRRKVAPVAKKAEALVCQTLGIVSNGQVVTKQVLDEFARRFEDQVSVQVLEALRVLFKLDEPDAAAAEEALIAHGGPSLLDLAEEDIAANA
uniref:Uncharacterized protein n=1 Tax=Avena sativa TaxID=4498 RepID=A0ACD5US02_AVESA